MDRRRAVGAGERCYGRTCREQGRPFRQTVRTPRISKEDTYSMSRRQVTLEEATAKAQSLNIMFMETSAKAGHNVKSLFKKIAMSLPGMEKDGQNSDAQNASRSTFDVNHPFPPL
jgi:translation initiation factor 2 gamma subunit (eIF-2gamma)